MLRSFRRPGFGLAAVGRRYLSDASPPLSPNELRLLQQVSRLEGRVYDLEEQLPARVQVPLPRKNRRAAHPPRVRVHLGPIATHP